MNIRNLTTKYEIRKLNETDIEEIYELMQGNPQYFEYCPPVATRESILQDMKALPPRTTYEDKYYMGFFRNRELVAVMDLILNFPNRETAFIGFFMMKKALQGKGIGTELFQDCASVLKKEGYKYIRLGFAKGNPQSEAFWMKNGFQRTGVEDVQEKYTVVVLEKGLSSTQLQCH